MDFTLRLYRKLLESLIASNYHFQTFEDFLTSPQERAIVLRHDVDLLPRNSLAFAEIQKEYGLSGSYYFRAVEVSWDDKIIQRIADLGHEVGYHYECLTTCRGDIQKGLVDFEQNLERLRKLVPVSTICMHGSPLSKFDSRDLWKFHSYRDFGIIGEPYFDVDFSKVLYLTDTGRRWDGDKVSVRDKVGSKNHPFKTTRDIMAVANAGQLPAQIMFTFHPQRWDDHSVPWVKELVLQNAKNVIKKYFFVKNT
ncbi:hypothetical protein [Runella salmonicolor]|uniref:Polysaccharide deacetylase n=1 Tax=Runella salmonicolor TaxID=2950278 RepID=A0ABT1FK76_9BACT|nr:hypothetical protein [Runella salmonicolor]MCP1381178.1 hypothetical protein [Runella salmonicolor]